MSIAASTAHPPPRLRSSPSARLNFWPAAILLVLTVASFWPALTADFINLDDPLYVSGNHFVLTGFHPASIRWAFTTRTGGYWIPLTWLSFMLDSQMFGHRPFGFHLGNVILHTANALLLYVFLVRATAARRPAFLAALLFAIHPLRVESVAWVTERKDVLSGLFALLALLAYERYARRPRPREFIAMLLLWVLSLMAKPMLVTLPILLLLLDYWPLARIAAPAWATPSNTAGHLYPQRSLRNVIIEKAIILPVAVFFGLLTIWTQAGVGAIADTARTPAGLRLANAAVSGVRYLWKIVDVRHLGVLYPLVPRYPLWQVAGAAVLLAALTIGTFLAAPRRPWLAVGWLWFAIAIFPVSGILQSGDQAMADRFTYFPSIGLAVAIAWSLPLSRVREPAPRAGLTGLVAVAVLYLCVTTYVQSTFWRDSQTILRHTIAVVGDSSLVRDSLGQTLLNEGHPALAVEQFQRATELRRRSREFALLGRALWRADRFPEAEKAFTTAISLEPRDTQAWIEYGVLLASTHRIDEAMTAFNRALQLDPANIQARLNIGFALTRAGRPRDAMPVYRDALRIDPENIDAKICIGNLLSQLGDPAAAADYLRQAIQSGAAGPETRVNLGVDLAQIGELDQAIEQYHQAIAEDPRNAEAHMNLAVALIKSDRIEDSIEESTLAVRFNPKLFKAWINLASAQLATDRPTQARQSLARARALDPNSPYVAALAQRLEQTTR